MRTYSVRVRLLIIAAVVAISIWSVYPPDRKIALGLDLKGGVELVLRVRTDDALKTQTELAAELVQSRLTRASAPGRVEVLDHLTFIVANASDPSVRDASAELGDRFTVTRESSRHVFRWKPEAAQALRRETVRLTIEILERRVNQLGLTEPSVTPYTEEDQIALQLPGVDDIDVAIETVQASGQLRLTLVERGPFVTLEAALVSYGGEVPPTVEILQGKSDSAGETQFYAVARQAAATGTDLRSVQSAFDEFNRPAVAFTLRPDAARRFGDLTARSINRELATVVGKRIASVATITSRIDESGQIVGLTREEMLEQVIALNSGALPAGVDYLDQHTVGSTLGEDSIRAGVLASVAGLALVMIFMLAYYRSLGMNALVSIVLNLLILLALMAHFDATLTLPGMAGLVLTIGMGVDSNVLIFERLREERAIAVSPRAAVRAAFDRVWIAIVDTHVASLLAAAVLFQFGTGAVRGFALTLALGLIANVFTAVFVSRTLLDLLTLQWLRAALSPSQLPSSAGRGPAIGARIPGSSA